MLKLFFTSCLLLLTTILLRSQDFRVDSDIPVKLRRDEWYRSPWIWVVGAAVLILALVAISQRKRE